MRGPVSFIVLICSAISLGVLLTNSAVAASVNPSQKAVVKGKKNLKTSGGPAFCGLIGHYETVWGDWTQRGIYTTNGVHPTSIEEACDIARNRTTLTYKDIVKEEKITCSNGGYFSIAADPNNSKERAVVGIVCGAKTRKAAEKAAIDECTAKGGMDCVTIRSAKNDGLYCGQNPDNRRDAVWDYMCAGTEILYRNEDGNLVPY